MTKREAEEKVKEITNLPASFSAVSKILKLTNDPNISLTNLAQAISLDQSLTAKILKLVNSGFYGIKRPISSISHAIALLGVNIIRSLILTSALFQNEEKLVLHSLGTAKCCGIIAELLNLKHPEEIAINGLLHDIGKMILKIYFNVEFGYIEKKVQDSDILFWEAEKKQLEYTHADLGGWILKHWHIPENLWIPVKNHHNFKRNDPYAKVTAVVHLADIFVRAKDIGSGWDNKIPVADSNVVNLLNLNPKDIGYIIKNLNMEELNPDKIF